MQDVVHHAVREREAQFTTEHEPEVDRPDEQFGRDIGEGQDDPVPVVVLGVDAKQPTRT